jgi:hypothetical protein
LTAGALGVVPAGGGENSSFSASSGDICAPAPGITGCPPPGIALASPPLGASGNPADGSPCD